MMMSPLPIILDPKPGRDIVLGRHDPKTGEPVTVDLTPYGAFPLGVSRQHAVITLTEEGRLALQDLKSDNGTFINGKRLRSGDVHYLRSGDAVWLSKMKLRIFFEG